MRIGNAGCSGYLSDMALATFEIQADKIANPNVNVRNRHLESI
jgi:hypothetical protein